MRKFAPCLDPLGLSDVDHHSGRYAKNHRPLVLGLPRLDRRWDQSFLDRCLEAYHDLSPWDPLPQDQKDLSRHEEWDFWASS